MALATEADAAGYLVELLPGIFPDVAGIVGIKPQALIRVASQGETNSLRKIGGVGRRTNENASLGKQRPQCREDKFRCDAKMLQHL